MWDQAETQAPAHGRPRCAIVHDFFTTEGGADRCAIEFARLLPDAIVYTSFFNERRFGGRIRFDPSISAGYLSRASWRGLLRQYFRYGMYKVRGIQKRPTILRPRHLVPAALVAIVVGGEAAGLIVPWGPLLAVGALAAWLASAAYSACALAIDHDTTVPDVIVAYACLHLGHGIGMWVGLVRFAPRCFIDRRGSVPALEAPSG